MDDDRVLKFLMEARHMQALPWEKRRDWMAVVAEPVVYHAISPRAARAVLEVFGILSDRGFNSAQIAEGVLRSFINTGGKVDGEEEMKLFSEEHKRRARREYLEMKHRAGVPVGKEFLKVVDGKLVGCSEEEYDSDGAMDGEEAIGVKGNWAYQPV